jgi:hypothetical protein
MQAVGQMDVGIHAFLCSEMDRGKCSASRPGRSTPKESAHDNVWPQTLSGHFREEENLLPLSEIEPWFLGDRLVA